MTAKGKLNFRFGTYADVIVAREGDMYYQIGSSKEMFCLTIHRVTDSQEKMRREWYGDIYDAIDAANADYAERLAV